MFCILIATPPPAARPRPTSTRLGRRTPSCSRSCRRCSPQPAAARAQRPRRAGAGDSVSCPSRRLLASILPRQRRRAPARGPKPAAVAAYAPAPPACSRAHEDVVDAVAAGVPKPGGDGVARVEVAAEHDGRAARPARRGRARRARRRPARGPRSAPGRAGCRPTCRRSRRTRVHHAPLGPAAQPCARGARRSRSPRTRIALAPPPQDLMTSGRARGDQRGAAAAASCARSARCARSRRTRGPARGGHHGGTSCSSATSHSQPASARGELGQQRARRVGDRAAVEEVPGQDAASRRILPALPRHFLTGAELDAPTSCARCSSAPPS